MSWRAILQQGSRVVQRRWVYTAQADDGEKDLYHEAIRQFTKSIRLVGTATCSRRVKNKELASVYYSCGYARIKSYESAKTVVDYGLLSGALEDFEKCCKLDPNHLKGIRAKTKLQDKLNHSFAHSLTEKIGPWLILLPALAIIGLLQSGFFFGIPTRIGDVAYGTLTFGALVFLVIGLYLPNILKIKVGAVEIEKSTVDLITTSGPIGINK